ncbi:class I SAM-dependent methyltransferase [Clostridium lundense]|uniref:class I SAM-dependent methyltransferase n=1 Tax=Clostridium lundense TaxID=319475 RepID=UPI0006875512|nr:class I SAM-dependent methyltransferase [Clostridium lundense]
MEKVRDHDEFYLKEDRKNNPKEYFKFIYNISRKYVDSLESCNILDVGCATGDFLYFLNSVFKNSKFTGIDVMDKLLDKAKDEVEDVEFINADIYTGRNLPDDKYDVIYMSGVHSIFDEYEPWIDNLMNFKKDTGRIYIFGIFNPEEIDVLIRSRKSSDSGPWQVGWNIFSKKTIANYINKKGNQCKFYSFNIDIDIDKKEDDPLRSWTFKIENEQREVINGLQILHKFYLLEII